MVKISVKASVKTPVKVYVRFSVIIALQTNRVIYAVRRIDFLIVLTYIISMEIANLI